MRTRLGLPMRLLSLLLSVLMPLNTAPVIYFLLSGPAVRTTEAKPFSCQISPQSHATLSWLAGTGCQWTARGDSSCTYGQASGQKDFLTMATDRCGNSVGQLVSETDALGQTRIANATSVSYDSIGRVSSTSSPLGTFQYGYVDATSRVNTVSYPNGQTASYSYYPDVASGGTGNGDDRLQQIRNSSPSGQTLSEFSYGYDPEGKITAWQRQLGAQPADRLALSYDDGDQLVAASKTDAASGNALGRAAYGYDAVGNRTSVQQDAAVNSFAANNLHQLTGGAPGGPMRFEGNLTQYAAVTVNGQPAAVDAGNHFVASATLPPGTSEVTVSATNPNSLTTTKHYQVTVAAGSPKTFSYDLNGNLLDDGARTYQWDAENRLVTISYTGTQNSTKFTYDGLGRRATITEWTNGAVTSAKLLVWDGMKVAQETDSVSGELKQYFGAGETIGGVPYYYTGDHLGSTREMTDAAGTVHAEYDYDSYGEKTKIAGDLEADFQYAGYYAHAQSGLNLAVFRAYDSGAGRWLNRDPLGEAGGMNLYGYVGGNPISGVDPLGLCFWGSVFGFGVSLLAGVAIGLLLPELGLAGLLTAIVSGLLVGGITDLATQLYNNGWDVGGVNWGSVAMSAVVGGILGGVGWGVGQLIGSAMRGLRGAAAETTAPVEKFSEYIFKDGATHGKDAVFRNLGYSGEHSAQLASMWEEQAAAKFANGDFTLGKLDQWGQRINISIDVPGIGSAAGKSSSMQSGWMIQPGGGIKLNTPFAGFTK